jgi:hypothetical protein
MPNVRKLSTDEVTAAERKRLGARAQISQEYADFLTDFAVGDYGEAILDEGEKRLTVQSRLKRAAAGHGFGLSFKRTRGNLLRWQVVEPQAEKSISTQAPSSSPEPEVAVTEAPAPTTTPRKRGRPAAKAADPIDLAAAPRRGRGRAAAPAADSPPASTEAPRRRGRPKSIPTAPSEEPRRRGRPRSDKSADQQ